MNPGEVREYLLETATTASRTADECVGAILEAAALMAESVQGGGKVLFCGNGGSAADSQHLATELVGTMTLEHLRPAIPAIALTTDTSILTAIGNDFGFNEIFERQVEALGRPGDVLVGISTSGNSEDVIRATERAGALSLRTIALTGETGGMLAEIAGVTIKVPSSVTSHIQECHIAVGQLLCLLVERELYPPA